MSLEPLPPSLEQGVCQFAQEQHISVNEAVRKLLATALEHARQAEKTPALGFRLKAVPTKPNLEVAEQKSIIGMFENDPEFDLTMDEVVASRAERYAGGR